MQDQHQTQVEKKNTHFLNSLIASPTLATCRKIATHHESKVTHCLSLIHCKYIYFWTIIINVVVAFFYSNYLVGGLTFNYGVCAPPRIDTRPKSTNTQSISSIYGIIHV